MKFCILMGSRNFNGNTAELCKPFIDTLKKNKEEIKYITLADKKISCCNGCYACQEVSDEYGCILKDDMQNIVESIIWADCIVLATPIYTWYCTVDLKAVLDRSFGLNKYYKGIKKSLLNGKTVAIITTHGYDAEYATKPFEIGIKRFCEHSKMNYFGMYSVRDIKGLPSFQTCDAVYGSKAFALSLIESER